MLKSLYTVAQAFLTNSQNFPIISPIYCTNIIFSSFFSSSSSVAGSSVGFVIKNLIFLLMIGSMSNNGYWLFCSILIAFVRLEWKFFQLLHALNIWWTKPETKDFLYFNGIRESTLQRYKKHCYFVEYMICEIEMH